MTSLSTVLFFTYPDHGQANVNLATAYELALAGASVHIASFAPLRSRIAHLQELIIRHCDTAHSDSDSRPAGSVSFRECKGFPSYQEMIQKHGLDIRTFPHSHGVFGALKSYTTLHAMMFPWDPEEHLAAIEILKEIIVSVKPEVVVIDALFYLAMDACQLLGQKFIIMTPNSIRDITVNMQPYFAALWKYPVGSSGFPFPLKWWQIPLNVYLYTRLALTLNVGVKFKHIQALRRSLGIEHRLTMSFYPGVLYICPALPETDFPLSVIPDSMTLCGPILMPFDPLEERDSALQAWLNNGPTVLVNPGSHSLSHETLAREMASAFRLLLEHHDQKGTGKIQVLWKARAKGDIQKAMETVIGKEMEEGRIRVVPWLDAEPVSVLQHPNLVCTVHHGGANSFFEGVWSGIPHIVLPVWLDTYDYVNRVEFLNIGIFGNRTSAPGVRAEELGQALVRVTGDTEEACALRSTAQRLKEVCRAKGVGRKLASEAILKEAGVIA